MGGGIFDIILKGASAFMDYNAKVKQGGMASRLELASAKSKAALIRKQAGEVKSAANAAYAGSGVDVSQGSPLEVQRKISYESEQDALFELLMGKRRAQAAKAGAQLSADASALGSAADIYSGWLKSRGSTYGGGGFGGSYGAGGGGSLSGAVE